MVRLPAKRVMVACGSTACVRRRASERNQGCAVWPMASLASLPRIQVGWWRHRLCPIWASGPPSPLAPPRPVRRTRSGDLSGEHLSRSCQRQWRRSWMCTRRLFGRADRPIMQRDRISVHGRAATPFLHRGARPLGISWLFMGRQPRWEFGQIFQPPRSRAVLRAHPLGGLSLVFPCPLRSGTRMAICRFAHA